MAGVAFMNIVRWNIAEDLKTGTGFPVHVTNGSMTRTMRKYSCIEKSHANDAFDMGDFHPATRQRGTACKSTAGTTIVSSKSSTTQSTWMCVTERIRAGSSSHAEGRSSAGQGTWKRPA